MKFFPVDINKIPLVPWRETRGSSDPEQHKLWMNLYRDRLAYWGMATGIESDVLVLDVDNKNDRNGFQFIQEKNLPLPQTAWQQTKSGGAHFIYRYPKDGRHYGNRTGLLQRGSGLDVRGEGGYIALYQDIDWSQVTDAPPWLIDAAGRANTYEISAHTFSTVGIAPQIAEPIILEALENIREAPEGESNNVLNIESFKLGQLVASGSITRDYAEQVLLDAALYRKKPLYEAKATIASGLNGGGQKPLTSPFPNEAPVPVTGVAPWNEEKSRWTPVHFTRLDLMDMTKLKKPQLFKDWSTEDIHITTADGGTGKTTLALFESVCLALGQPFLGFPCLQPGARTLFIIGEDDAGKIGAILGAIVRQMGLMDDPEKLQKIIDCILVKKDADLCLISKDKAGFLHVNHDAFDKINQAIEDLKPKRIIFDPIASFWGSENALNDMNRVVSKFMGSIASRGISVEMINHMGKSSSANKDMTQFAGRGGSGLPSHSRVSRVLRELGPEEFQDKTGEAIPDGQSAILCNVNKFSDGSPFYNKPFIIVRHGYLFSRRDLPESKVKEIQQEETDLARVMNFIREERGAGKYPTKPSIEAFFAFQKIPIGPTRLKHSLQMLHHIGFEGEKIKPIPNPDVSMKDSVYVLTDMDGKEV